MRSNSLSIGKLLERHAALSVLIVILLAYGVAVPPRETFGSASMEHAKDLLAFIFAATGLASRAVARGSNGHVHWFRTRFYAANMLTLFAIFLMHGNYYVVVFGALLCLLAYQLIVSAGIEAHRGGRWNQDVSPASPRSLGARLCRIAAREWATVALTFGLLLVTEVYEEMCGDHAALLQSLLLTACGILAAGSGVLLLGHSRSRSSAAAEGILEHGHAGPSTRGTRVDGRVGSVDVLENLLSFGHLTRILQGTLKAASLRPGDRLVDVGCGTGALAMAAAAGGAGEALGIDATPGMIAVARRSARHAGSRARFELGAGEALPLPDGYADAVTSSYFFHHLPSDLKPLAFREVWRVLAPGGRLVVTDYARPHGLLGLVASLPMRANYYEHVRSQLTGELETLIEAEGLGPPEIAQRFLGYITIYRLTKSKGADALACHT